MTSSQSFAIHTIDTWFIRSGMEYRGAFRARFGDQVVYEDDGTNARPFASAAGALADADQRGADWNAAQAR